MHNEDLQHCLVRGDSITYTVIVFQRFPFFLEHKIAHAQPLLPDRCIACDILECQPLVKTPSPLKKPILVFKPVCTTVF